MKTVVISLGGSIIVPDKIDVSFIAKFKELLLGLVDTRFILICGGGGICRTYQQAARRVGVHSKNDLDWIGIRATRLNAELVRACFGDEAYGKVIHDPAEEIETEKKIIIGAGFEPGSSTDLRAVQLAVRMDAAEVINMSNIDYVYTSDPKTDPGAKKIEAITWAGFRKLVGDEWDPGMNKPFDPVASREAEAHGLRVFIIGNDLENLGKVFTGDNFKGTTIL